MRIGKPKVVVTGQVQFAGHHGTRVLVFNFICGIERYKKPVKLASLQQNNVVWLTVSVTVLTHHQIDCTAGNAADRSIPAFLNSGVNVSDEKRFIGLVEVGEFYGVFCWLVLACAFDVARLS